MATQPDNEKWKFLRTEKYPNLYLYSKIYQNPNNKTEYIIKYDGITGDITEQGIQNGVIRFVNKSDTTYITPGRVNSQNDSFTLKLLKHLYNTGNVPTIYDLIRESLIHESTGHNYFKFFK